MRPAEGECISIRESGCNDEGNEKTRERGDGKGRKYKRIYQLQTKIVEGQDLISWVL